MALVEIGGVPAGDATSVTSNLSAGAALLIAVPPGGSPAVSLHPGATA
ncbi:hypothetical protein [Thermostaphylospora chromogena]|nr:hypothetical protein [Thermostaphylospora chromogena]